MPVVHSDRCLLCDRLLLLLRTNRSARHRLTHAIVLVSRSFHGSYSVDLHRTMLLDGVCFRNTAGQIKKGAHKISLMVEGNGDCYTGWSSNSRFTVREIVSPTNIRG